MNANAYTVVDCFSMLSVFTPRYVGGHRSANEANNAFQLFPSTGTFTAGTITIYGVK